MKKFFLSFLFVLMVALGLSRFGFVHAQSLEDEINKQMEITAVEGDMSEKGEVEDPRVVVARFVMLLLSFLGSIFIVLFIYAGYHMITSHGEEEKIAKARKTMQGAVIGFFIILLSYSLANFFTKKALDATGVGQTSTNPGMYDTGSKSTP